VDRVTDYRIDVTILLVVLKYERGGGSWVGLITPSLDVLCTKSCVDGWQHICTFFHGLAFS